MNLFGMSQLINCATRITLTSSSIIDLIFVSEPANISQSGVLHIGFSDHQVIYCTRKLFRCKVGTHKSIKLRPCKHYDRTVFNNMLSDIDWNCIYSSKHVDEAWQYFTTHFYSILNRVAPLTLLPALTSFDDMLFSAMTSFDDMPDSAMTRYDDLKTILGK